jgi:predicted metal-binding protein
MELEEFKELTARAGLTDCGIVDARSVGFSQEVRKMCEQNTCRMYGKTWACPPAVGTVGECRDRCLRFRRLLVFSGRYPLEDSFDYEGMMAAMADFKVKARALEAWVKPRLSSYLMLANEGCGICGSCTYPGAPCRFPDRMHGSIEAYGIFVSEVAAAAGVEYNNGPDTVTYFGGIFF